MDTLLQAIWGRLRGIRPPAVQLAVLERPRSRRDALNRVLMIAAVVAAAVIPVFLGRGSGDLDEGAGAMFRGLQAELTAAELELQELRDAGDEDSGAGREAAARVEQLRAATQLGYLQRGGRRDAGGRPGAGLPAADAGWGAVPAGGGGSAGDSEFLGVVVRSVCRGDARFPARA